MAKGGRRAGAGRKRKIKTTPHPVLGADDVKVVQAEFAWQTAAKLEDRKAVEEYDISPLAYALMVINDRNAHPDRRDRMAAYAMPFMHPKLESVGQGKKEERQRAAEEKASGKYLPPPAPKTNAPGTDTRQ